MGYMKSCFFCKKKSLVLYKPPMFLKFPFFYFFVFCTQNGSIFINFYRFRNLFFKFYRRVFWHFFRSDVFVFLENIFYKSCHLPIYNKIWLGKNQYFDVDFFLLETIILPSYWGFQFLKFFQKTCFSTNEGKRIPSDPVCRPFIFLWQLCANNIYTDLCSLFLLFLTIWKRVLQNYHFFWKMRKIN